MTARLDIPLVGHPIAIGEANGAHEVVKYGRTTERTVGRIASSLTDITIGLSTGDYVFYDQLWIESSDAPRLPMAETLDHSLSTGKPESLSDFSWHPSGPMQSQITCRMLRPYWT